MARVYLKKTDDEDEHEDEVRQRFSRTSPRPRTPTSNNFHKIGALFIKNAGPGFKNEKPQETGGEVSSFCLSYL